MKWAQDKNKREIALFYIAIIGAILGSLWTLFLWWEEKQPDPTLRPHLKVHSKIYTNHKTIEIKNTGMGAAIVKSATFCRQSKCTDNVVELFNIPNVQWDTFINLSKNSTITSNSNITLLQLSESSINDKTYLREFQNQKSGITVNIEYADIEGNEYGPLNTSLK